MENLDHCLRRALRLPAPLMPPAQLLKSSESMWATMTPGMEYEALRDLYLKVPAPNFSDEVLSARPSDLAVIRARGLGWSDLGEPERVLSMLRLKNEATNWKG